MYEYSHGGNAAFENGNENIIDLSANINPLGMPSTVEKAIAGAITDCVRYPDSFSTKLRKKISEFEQISPDWIFCGNGASDIIFRLPRAVNAKKVLITAPTFSDYERAARSFGSEIVRYTLTENDGFTMNIGFIDAIQNVKPDLIYVCNPNNPTGKLTEAGFIEELLDYCQKIEAWVAVDECFLDFTEQAVQYTSKNFLSKYPNLVILKAFTKMFSLPGIRLGYSLCADKSLNDSLYLHGADWPVSNLAQAAGIAALEGAECFIKKTVEYVSGERTGMEKELERLGYKVFASNANYIFFQNPYPFDLREKLDEKGIRIRSCGNYHGLDNSYYRVAVSTKANNAVFLGAVSEIR